MLAKLANCNWCLRACACLLADRVSKTSMRGVEVAVYKDITGTCRLQEYTRMSRTLCEYVYLVIFMQ